MTAAARKEEIDSPIHGQASGESTTRVDDATCSKAYVASPWFRFFPSDFLKGTRGMRPATVGIYVTILVTLHERGEPLAPDMKSLGRRCGGVPASVMENALGELFTEGLLSRKSGGIWSPAIDVEISHRREISERRAENARKGRQKTEQIQHEKSAIADRESETQSLEERENDHKDRSRSSANFSSTINGKSHSTFEGSTDWTEGARPEGAPSMDSSQTTCVDDEENTYDIVECLRDGKILVKSHRTGDPYKADIDFQTNRITKLEWYGEDVDDVPF